MSTTIVTLESHLIHFKVNDDDVERGAHAHIGYDRRRLRSDQHEHVREAPAVDPSERTRAVAPL